jgi:AcrR family transcriptional regulator
MKRARRGSLSLDRIVSAALELADAEGIEAVSMARVAGHLGFTPMSLYRHVDGKDELVALMVDAASGDPPAADRSEGWRARLERWAWALRAVVLRHPWLLDLPLSRLPPGPRQLGWMEAAFAALAGTPLAPEEKAAVTLMLHGLVMSDVGLRREADAGRGADASFGALAARAADPERYPAIAEVMATGALDDEDGEPDAFFAFALARTLDGIGVLVDRGAAAA